MGWIAAAADYIGSFFVSSAGADTAAATASTAAASTTTAAASTAAAASASTAAIEAGGYAAVEGGIAAGAAPTAVAAGTTAAGASIATTVSEASAIASGASALYTLSQGAGRINVPPVPVNTGQTDLSVANAEQAELQRRQAAGGLQSTIGTGGSTAASPSQAGAILNPSTLSSKSLLGA